MKKTYSNPTLRVVKMKTATVICASETQSIYATGTATEWGSRRGVFDDDDDEE